MVFPHQLLVEYFAGSDTNKFSVIFQLAARFCHLLASTGDAQDFGDLTDAARSFGGTCS